MSSQQKEDQHACRVTRKKVNARKMLVSWKVEQLVNVFDLTSVTHNNESFL